MINKAGFMSYVAALRWMCVFFKTKSSSRIIQSRAVKVLLKGEEKRRGEGDKVFFPEKFVQAFTF